MQAAGLQAIGVSKRYRRTSEWALRNVDLTFADRSVTALVGPNGAGKTTLIRCFMGFETPTLGKTEVRGIDPRRERAGALRHVGYVGQDAILYRDLTVDDHFAMARALRRGFDRALARRRLDGINVPLGARVSELSGGQRAQVSLAIALACHADVLLLDEPIASLDPFARQEFFGILADAIRAEAPTVLISSHIVGDLETVCDSLVVLAPARVMLHQGLAAAKATHRLVPMADDLADVVSTFSRPDRSTVALVRVRDGGDATLDDLALGYLAAAAPHHLDSHADIQ